MAYGGGVRQLRLFPNTPLPTGSSDAGEEKHKGIAATFDHVPDDAVCAGLLDAVIRT